MSMGSESSARDLSRAHIQRTAEVVVSREVAEPFFAERRAYIPLLTAEEIFMTDSPYPPPATPWVAAQRVSKILLDSGADMPATGGGVEAINNMVAPFMYSNTVRYGILEGLESQTHFPLHLAEDISAAARQAGISGFETGTFGGIISLLKRPDFRAMIDASAFTANAVWGSYSTSFHTPYRSSEGRPHLGFVFDAAGNADFAPAFKTHLHEALVKVNRAGNSGGGYDTVGSTSSGCPARHVRPHFTGSETDVRNIEVLAGYFGISAEEVTVTRESSVITQGLDLLVEGLEYVQPLVEAHFAKVRAARLQVMARPVVESHISVT